MKISPPRLSSTLSECADFSALVKKHSESEEKISDHSFKNEEYISEDMSYLSFSGCVFDNCRFSESDLEKTSFADCVFKNCDLSNVTAADSYFSRCHFISCKFVGAEMRSSLFVEILCEGTSFSYANFHGASFRNASLLRCDFSSSELTECTLKGFYPDDCKFIATWFAKTSLNGVDLSTSRIEGLRLSQGFSELRGARVDSFQASQLALLLGVKIV